MSFDYFYNREAEQYIHYTMPKLFFCNEQLRSLSVNAKFLYAILLDRAKLSFKNGFIDDDGKVYIHFTQAEIMKLLNCGRTKVSEYFSELDEPKGVGLIERKQKTGVGKSDRIYVKNFAKPLDVTCRSSEDKAPFSRFAYFHDMESLRFENYQVPKTLFLDEHISKISNIAKMAYSLMLDRTKLSMSKGWQDKDGRIYIIYPQKELQEILGCSLKTVNSALKELDTKSGVGLIERTRQGMNNPDIIYILDYSTDLKYKPKIQQSSEPDNPDIQSVNIGDVKTEHREVQNLNIGSVKSEHIYNNNTDSIDTDFIDTDSISQSFADEKANLDPERQTDGQTDQTKKSKKGISFAEMLSAIGYNSDMNRYVPDDINETYFDGWAEDERDIESCTIPYWFKTDKKAMSEALKFFFCYSEYKSEKDREIRILLDRVIKSLVEMTTKDYCTLDGMTVKYYQIIDEINNLCHNSLLTEWLYSFKDEWSQILSERDIKRPEVYIKACIWNSMRDYQFKENNSVLQGEYDCTHGFPNRTKTEQENKINYGAFVNDFTTI